MKSDKNLFATTDCGCSQIPTWADHGLCELLVGGIVFFHVEVRDFLAFGSDHATGGAGHFDRRGDVNSLFPRIDLFDYVCVHLRKDPLRFDAAVSAFAVVIPVNLRGHRVLRV